jgi:class 3 adenylate cyclase
MRMSAWTNLRLPMACDALVGFYDLTGYTAFSAKREPREVLDILTGYFALTGTIIAGHGGKLIKPLGDAGLCAFFAADADAGVHALRQVQTDGDGWLAARGYKAHAKVKLHIGPVALGLVGAPGAEILDIYGKTVNTAAVLESQGFAMTPAVFRSLAPDTRKLFKKHTPPVSYIDVNDNHAALGRRGGGDMAP